MVNKIPKSWILLTIAIIVIIVLSSYIFKISYSQKREQSNLLIYQRGLQDGFAQAVVQLIQQSQSCNPVPLFAGNTTVNLINTACLQR